MSSIFTVMRPLVKIRNYADDIYLAYEELQTTVMEYLHLVILMMRATSKYM